MSRPASKAAGSSTVPSHAPVRSRGRRTLFRWLAGLLAPAVVLLAVESVLRLVGCGYPTEFFLPAEATLPGLFKENPQFGWRFFPPALARAPDPVRLSRVKPPGTCRVFVLGESAALGDPAPAYGLSRILGELLGARCPGTRFEVVNVAMTAINSHAIVDIARDCVPFKADFWIVYMGNNEVVGPFGAGSVFGGKAPPLPLIRAALAAKSTRLGQTLDAGWQRVTHGALSRQRWEGMKMMLNEQVRAEDPALDRVSGHFARNLRKVLEIATRAGVKPIVCSVGVNLKDCPPFASTNRPGLPRPSQAEWERLWTSGTERESRQDYAQALALYREAAAIDDTYAALPFRIARCALALGDVGVARSEYARARDLDALRFRADSRINRMIREVCAKYSEAGVCYFDSEALVRNSSAQGIPGAEYFWDHVHFNFGGNYLLARGLADRMLPLLPVETRRLAEGHGHGRLLTEAECAERLAFTDWDQRLVLQEMWQRVQDPPFTGQLDHDALLDRWARLRAELERKTDREGLATAVRLYEQALAARDQDWVLHYRLASLLDAAGDAPGAERHWKRVLELIPGYADACFKLADLSFRLSRLAEAADYYRQVLRSRPRSFEAMNGLGLVRMSEGSRAEAAQLFEAALRVEPRFAQGRVNWGLLLSQDGRLAEAETQYGEALRSDPENAAAHINLGNLLANQQRHPEAIAVYRQAIRLRPREATIHFGLGNSLEAAGLPSEAAERYRAAITLNPALAEAHFNFGVLLAKGGDYAAATRCFEESVRLSPDDPQAHLNLGVALAKQNRLPEALGEFQAVLRLDPSNAAARHYLGVAASKASNP